VEIRILALGRLLASLLVGLGRERHIREAFESVMVPSFAALRKDEDRTLGKDRVAAVDSSRVRPVRLVAVAVAVAD
jgi:hypothetical protein